MPSDPGERTWTLTLREGFHLIRGSRLKVGESVSVVEEGRLRQVEAELDDYKGGYDQQKALARVHKGTSERLAADLETMRMRTPPNESKSGPEVCEHCGLHPYDFTAGEYEDAIREAEARVELLETELAEARAARVKDADAPS